MNRTPLVSIAMPTLNRKRFIPMAVDSILAQTFPDWELIVSDGGSKDGTLEILDRYASGDNRVRVFRHPGLDTAAARNAILGEARGAFLAVLDSDDLARPERLEMQLAALRRNPGLIGVGSDIDFVDDDGNPIVAAKYKQRLNDPDRIRQKQREGWNCFVHSSMLLRLEAVLEAGGYRPFFSHAEDDDLFLRLLDKGDLANLPEKLVSFRCHRENSWRPGRIEYRVAALASAHLRLSGLPDPVDTRNTPLDNAFLASLLEKLGKASLPVRLCWIGYLQHQGEKTPQLDKIWQDVLGMALQREYSDEILRHWRKCREDFPDIAARLHRNRPGQEPPDTIGRWLAAIDN